MKSIETKLATIRSELRSAALRANDVETALHMAESYGNLAWHNNDGFLADDALEASLIGKFSGILRNDEAADPVKKTVRWLHILSETFPHGGHSRLALALMAEQSRAGESLSTLVTRATSEDFAEACCEMGVPLEVLGGSLLERARAIYRRAIQAEVVVLHIHPDDIGAALAARLAGDHGTRILFVNHADHLFSFGSGAAGAVLEISGIGWRQTVLYRKARSQSYLGIPVDVSPDSESDVVSRRTGPAGRDATILSIGSPAKYLPDSRNDFPAFVSDLLDRNECTFDLIGPDGTEPWWHAAKERHGNRIRFHGYLPYAATNQLLSEASAYVDSFPFAGSTSFPQALIAGLPVFGLTDQANGYGPLDGLRSSNAADLVDEITSYLETGVEKPLQATMREKLRTEASSSACVARLSDAANRTCTPIPADMVPTNCNPDVHRKNWINGNSVFVPFPARAPLALRIRFIWRCLTDTRLQASMGRRKMVSWLLGANVKDDLAPPLNSTAAVGWKAQFS